MVFTQLNFGKHIGITLPQVVFRDLNYFFWVRDKLRTLKLKEEGDFIFKCITNIKIPKENPNEYFVDYVIHESTMKFYRFDIIKKENFIKLGNRIPLTGSVIDLSIVESLSEYDKSGSQRIIDYLKEYCFGNKSYKMTKERCAAFFNDSSNFIIKESNNNSASDSKVDESFNKDRPLF